MAGPPVSRPSRASAQAHALTRAWRHAVRRLDSLETTTKILLGCGILGSAILAWVVVSVAQ
jgi:hypothetical protein